MNLSEHFTLQEATASAKARMIKDDNQPDQKQLQQMKYTAEQMEKVRKILGDLPIRVNSWFRSPAVNKAVGGVSTSQHAKGEAVDFTCSLYGNPYEVCVELSARKGELQYDQLIYEHTWIHISFVNDRKPRLQDLTYMGAGKYIKGIK
jgi:hypothetical protein